jgi:hypothetical protein
MDQTFVQFSKNYKSSTKTLVLTIVPFMSIAVHTSYYHCISSYPLVCVGSCGIVRGFSFLPHIFFLI